MSVGLRFDPRKIKSFSDIGLPAVLLEKIQTKLPQPLPIQNKILALNGSGCSILAHSVPRLGKSTAAMLSLLSTEPTSNRTITNLVLVPSPALADQYYETMRAWGTDHVANYLYRTGSEELDNEQHEKLVKNPAATTLIGTPHRILDYLSSAPSLISFENLKQLVIDELDFFAPKNVISDRENKPIKDTPLEKLVEHVMNTSSPIITALLTDTSALANFARFRDLLEKSQAPMYEISEAQPGGWTGEVNTIELSSPLSSAEECAKAAKKHWDGTGLVVIPADLSPLKVQELLPGMGAVVANPVDVCGLNIDNLNRLYVLGSHSPEDVERLKWFMSGDAPKMYIISNPE